MLEFVVIIITLIFLKFIYDTYLTNNTEEKWQKYKILEIEEKKNNKIEAKVQYSLSVSYFGNDSKKSIKAIKKAIELDPETPFYKDRLKKYTEVIEQMKNEKINKKQSEKVKKEKQEIVEKQKKEAGEQLKLKIEKNVKKELEERLKRNQKYKPKNHKIEISLKGNQKYLVPKHLEELVINQITSCWKKEIIKEMDLLTFVDLILTTLGDEYLQEETQLFDLSGHEEFCCHKIDNPFGEYECYCDPSMKFILHGENELKGKTIPSSKIKIGEHSIQLVDGHLFNEKQRIWIFQKMEIMNDLLSKQDEIVNNGNWNKIFDLEFANKYMDSISFFDHRNNPDFYQREGQKFYDQQEKIRWGIRQKIEYKSIQDLEEKHKQFISQEKEKEEREKEEKGFSDDFPF